MRDPAKLLKWYELGAMTRLELLTRLCQAAADVVPEQLVPVLPPDVLAEIHEWSASPPESPDRCRVFGSVCAIGEYDWDRHFREESRLLYDGLWRWHQYFVQSEPCDAPGHGGT